MTKGDIGTLLWRVNTTDNVQAIEALGNLVIIGWHFTSVARVTRVRVAALSMTNGGLDPWAPAIEGQWGGPWALLVSDNHLCVGGQFTTVAGVPQFFFTRFTFSCAGFRVLVRSSPPSSPAVPTRRRVLGSGRMNGPGTLALVGAAGFEPATSCV